MSGSARGHADILRWYPPRWRERYGEEFAAMLDDTLDGARPTMRLRLSLVWAGLCERGRQAALFGTSSPSPERVRVGSLVVLCAWSVFVLAGISFSKASEHFQAVIPQRQRAVPEGAFHAVVTLAVIGGLVVGMGAVVALPAFRRFLHEGGWRSVRRTVLRAAIATGVLVIALVALVAVANHLTPGQRNAEVVPHPVARGYLVQFLATAALLAATVGLWTAAIVATARRLVLRPLVVRLEAVLAAGLAVVMVLSTVATGIWWAATATDGPQVLRGLPISAGSSPPIHPDIAPTMIAMLISCMVAAYGVVRIARSWHDVRPAS
ncbi:MAG TPA: hypothetical protein VGM93_13895 [Acidimicrobiales bacterium]